MTVATWSDLRRHAERELSEIGVDVPAVEARWMVEQVSGYDGAELVANELDAAPERARVQLDEMLARRRDGEPLQYVLGTWSFRGIDLFVDRRVLIPRPETEVTAEVAIEEARRLGARRGRPDPWAGAAASYVVADLGTGSGAMALALAAELPDAEVWATDVSEDALAVARANLAGAGLPATRVRLAQGSWYEGLPDELRGQFLVIVANPPYVAEYERLQSEVVDYEPNVALVGGETGYEAIDEVVEGARDWLSPGGTLVCEISPRLVEGAVERAIAAGFPDATVLPDLTGRPRVLVARLG